MRTRSTSKIQAINSNLKNQTIEIEIGMALSNPDIEADAIQQSRPSKKIKYAVSSDGQDSDSEFEPASDFSLEEISDQGNSAEDMVTAALTPLANSVEQTNKEIRVRNNSEVDFVEPAQDEIPTPPTTGKKPKKSKLPKIDFNIIHPELQNVWKDLSEQTQPEVTVKQPDGLLCTLLPFQLKGVQFMKGQEESSYKGGILADEMVFKFFN